MEQDPCLGCRILEAECIAEEQHDNEGLWFKPQTAHEACLQQALRKMHQEIEEIGHLARELGVIEVGSTQAVKPDSAVH